MNPRGAAAARDLLARLIHALAEGAPAGELDALAAGCPEQEMVLQAVEHGWRIRDMLERRERREQEAQALYETARDLTSLRDVDEVLHAIVDRVRQLLGCDSTYIALIDEETGDAYMRVTSGAVTPGIQFVRQSPGWGVGGRVIKTGQPFATANYLADPRIRRDPSVAVAVGEDGIVSIAGVPMKLGHRVVGALFAADRHERTFEQSEIALLSSLADHASVVIENARLFARIRATTHDLREANRRLSAQRQALERASAAHEQLMPLALTQVDLDEFARTLARILGGTVALVGGASLVLASASTPHDGVALETLLLLDPARSGDTATAPAASGTAVLPVRAGSETFGHLLFARGAPITETDARTLERAAQTAALLLLMQRQTSIVEDELRGELVEDLLAERIPDWEALRRRAERFGVLDPDVPHTAVVLSAAGVPRRQLRQAAVELAARHDGLASEHAGQVVLLLPGIDAGDAARTVPAQLRRAIGVPVTAGTAGPAVTAPAIRELHRGAARCHQLLLGLGREGEGASLEELGVVGLVLEQTTPEQVHRLVARALGPLLDYDAGHSAPLLATLECYFACGQSPPAVARELRVHVNTVYQRLDRIDHVLGGRDWRQPQGAFDMQLALQFHRLLTGGPAAP
ncbi:MAG: GAF domain-containing protein [Pseudonocardiaceae bacterium]|nr:GAF domain-containing protein [Pseudonocardiaceae bacterium]